MQNFTRKTLTIPALLASFALGSLLTLKAPEAITTEMVHQASQLFGLTFTEAERDSMLTNLEDYRKGYEKVRAIPLTNDVAPALYFNPGRQVPGNFTRHSLWGQRSFS